MKDYFNQFQLPRDIDIVPKDEITIVPFGEENRMVGELDPDIEAFEINL